MSYQIATVVLRDGKRFPKTVISGGVITKVGDSNVIPFEESDIETIVVDHGK